MSPRIQSLLSVCAFAWLAVHSATAAAEPIRLDLRDPAWELAGEDTVVEELDGRLALRLGTGRATWRGIEFLDGTIELELQVTSYRSFSFLGIRHQSDGEFEDIYFRAHKSLLPDAIQYTPVYKRSSQWQLYHDARYTAAAPFPPGEWIPIKVVVEGRRAAVFVGETKKPQLVVPRLAREPRPGYISLRSFLPLGTPAGTHITSFANVVVLPGVVDYEFPEPEGPVPAEGRMTSWEISPPFVPAAGPVIEMPEAGGEWQTVPANAAGLVELERHVTRPEGVRRVGVLARHRVMVDAPTTARLDLGFSDEVSVFLNGRLLVADDESYSYNLPRRQGLLTDGQLSVFLSLEPGDNELVLAIVDRFGGWGLSGKLEMAAGEAEPAPGPAAEAATTGESSSAVARLAWMAGCWRGEAGEECWLAPRGGMMIGVNRGPEREGKAPFFELLRVVEDEQGLVLQAQPGGRFPPTPFRATEIGDSRVVFANPEHDFPQRITYSLDGQTLRARVEAQRDGEWRGFEQVWSRGSWSAD